MMKLWVDTLHNWVEKHQTSHCQLVDALRYQALWAPAKRKYKGRLVYRRDKSCDWDSNIVLFQEAATSPTAIVVLQITLWYGMLSDQQRRSGFPLELVRQRRQDTCSVFELSLPHSKTPPKFQFPCTLYHVFSPQQGIYSAQITLSTFTCICSWPSSRDLWIWAIC